ncbi:MAG: PQQ-dependent sugar dehydrogenase [Cyclobacteriaceae bacterium]
MKKLVGLGIVAVALASCVKHTDEQKVVDDVPQANRFEKEVFASNLFEPTELVVLPNDKILFTQRRGGIKQYDLKTSEFTDYDSIPVFHELEDGLMGIGADPNFQQNRWLYLYYSVYGERPVQALSRFTYTSSGLKNEKVLLEVDVQREECCHTGGSIEFGGDGLLYLSTGDDTNPFNSDGFAPIDDRAGRAAWDARRSSSNTNDLRGKILRIKPEANGTYSIPPGNLFEDDDPLTRPEIYVMGCRNPYRIAVDSKRGWLFWGDVGADAQKADELRGPRGHDEFNVALEAGYFGWPLFVGDNKAYRDYSFKTKKSGSSFDPKAPINNSPNNTGIEKLPPAMPAKIFYPYANSPEFPQVGNGGRNAMAGPVYYADEYDSQDKYPDFFNGRVFFYDWIRGFIYSLDLDDQGNPIDWYPFMPDTKFNNLMDMTFGPDGQLYAIEYGTGWFTRNEDARLLRIKYSGGNRPPVLEASLSQTNGKAPLEVAFDASGSLDYDGDKLTFIWKIDDEKIKEDKFTYTFDKEGIYYPELIVRDQKGNKARKQFVVEVGNKAPEVSLTINGSQTFFWKGRKVVYDVQVSDAEDGSLGSGIEPTDVDFDIQHFQSLDKAEVLGHQKPVSGGLTLINSLDCKGCHKIDGSSIGPSYTQVSDTYKNDAGALNYLSYKIINGGGGVWGENMMSAHPELSLEDANSIVNYILSLTHVNEYPLSGEYIISKSTGQYLFSASYKDKGKKPLSPVSRTSGIMLKSNVIEASEFDFSENVGVRVDESTDVYYVKDIFDGSSFGFNDLDLTDIGVVKLKLRSLKKDVEVKLTNNKTGAVLGSVTLKKSNGIKCCSEIEIEAEGKTDINLSFHNSEVETELIQIETLQFIPKKQ